MTATRKGGTLARHAAIAGQNVAFRTFLWHRHKLPAFTEQAAADAIRTICGTRIGDAVVPLESRKDLDHDDGARDRWRDLWAEFKAWEIL